MIKNKTPAYDYKQICVCVCDVIQVEMMVSRCYMNGKD